MSAETEHRDRASRLRLAGRSLLLAAHALVSLALLLLVACAAVGGALWIGAPLARAVLVVQRRHADRQRATAGRTLGVRIPSAYQGVPERGLFARLGVVVRDRATRRDLAWLCVDATGGLFLVLLPLSFVLTAAWNFVMAGVLWAFFPRLRTELTYVGPLLDGTSPVGYLVVVLAGVAAAAIGVGITGPVVVAHARMARHWLGPPPKSVLAKRVDDLARSRADSLHMHAAEIRRIERDLHDGAQARLIALGMNLGMVQALLADRPEVGSLLAEARQNNLRALAELRDLVHGIRPPVLADRGLDGAVRALAVPSPLPIDVDIDLAGQIPGPAESAAYFAIAECVANAVKHARANRVAVRVRHRDGMLVSTVWDDGAGGADPSAGTGLLGVARRLSAFDGTVAVASPAGGPTTITMELPCELSSPKTSPFSGTA